MSAQLNKLSDTLSAEASAGFLISGHWREPATEDRLDIVSPMTEETIATFPAGSPADMDAAVAAARRAFDHGAWPASGGPARGECLRRIATLLRERGDSLALAWTAQVGAPAGFTRWLTPMAADIFDYYADLAGTMPFEEIRAFPGGSAIVSREPAGVCAIISPWNAPLVLLSQAVAPALAAGCTVVAKPSPESPIEALILGECARAAGLPDGVLNIVPAGRDAGDHLVRHAGVDKVSFTGSVAAGKHIARVCADRLARVSLELGGKSAAILLEDADMANTAVQLVNFAMPFTGQVCFSQTRVLAPRSRYKQFVEAFAAAAQAVAVGDPADAATQMGPLSIARQRDRVEAYVAEGVREGATLVTGGQRPRDLNRGFFFEPTVFADVDNTMRIAREEIFGPVACVIPYDDIDEALQIANDTDYGLSGSVYSTQEDHALRVASRLRTGNVTINGLALHPSIPFGGFKQSGYGRVGGPEGMAGYLEYKAIYRLG
jgi:aldehyde dehydrogenase (NAD+)